MTFADEAVITLERDWPAWQIWYVPTVVGPWTWSARRWDDADASHTVIAHSAAALVALLQETATP